MVVTIKRASDDIRISTQKAVDAIRRLVNVENMFPQFISTDVEYLVNE